MDLLSFKMGQKSVPAPEPPVIQPLSVTENGTYEPEEGVDGYAPVTVNVSGGGGGGSELLHTNTHTYTAEEASALTEVVFEFDSEVEPNYVVMLNETNLKGRIVMEMLGGVINKFDPDLESSRFRGTNANVNSYFVISGTSLNVMKIAGEKEPKPTLTKNGNHYTFSCPRYAASYPFYAGTYRIKAYHIDFPTA